jgi:coenzyme F420-reducing hydrogenase beta subunit
MKPAITMIDNNDCIGCYGCFNVCTQKAIDMYLNNEGFLAPSVNYEKCINCGICQEYCPIIVNQLPENLYTQISFASWSKNDHTRIKSSSGGVFTEIAKIVLKEGGIVFGVAFNNSFKARHISIESEEDISLIRGSKYVQSHVDDAYQKAVSIALQGRPVLFSGTPCQIAAMNLLKRSNPKIEIYTCEIICYGVPSESVFRSYLDYLSKIKNSQVKEFSFRDKTFGWKQYGTKIVFYNGEEYFQIHQRDPFMIGFSKNIYLRSICYDCPFAKIPRVSDITLGDLWGVSKKLDDPKGVSVVIINTPKGEKLFEKVTNVEKVKVTLGQIAFYNPRLVTGHLERGPYRKDFYNLLETKGFQAVMEKYLKPYTWFQKCLLAPKYVFKILLRYIRIQRLV